MAGRTGCGICGTENLDKVYKEVSRLPNTYTFDLKHYHFGLQKIREAQQNRSRDRKYACCCGF